MSNTTVATAKYGTVINAIGSAKIADCILNGKKINITAAAVGDGGGAYYKPTREQVALKNECWRGEIAYARINEANPNMIDVKFIVPADVGGFTIREVALIDADGDTVAIGNTPDAEKIAVTDGVSFPITMVMHILVDDASVVSFSINPDLDTVSREEMEQAIKNYYAGVGSALIRPITIPAAAWAPVATDDGTEPPGGYTYTADVTLAEVKDAHFPVMALDIQAQAPAAEAALCPTIETLDGIVRFWAKKIPTVDLTGTIMLRSENLNGDATIDGTDQTVDIASPEEVAAVIREVFGAESVTPEIATDEEVAETVQEVFGEQSSADPNVATDEEVAAAVSDIFGE